MRLINPKHMNHIKSLLYYYAYAALYGLRRYQSLQVGDISLDVDMLDMGGRAYRSKKAFETVNNPLYALISYCLKPDLAIDVGANYGLVTCVIAKQMETANVVAIEASRNLIAYLSRNVARNCPGRVSVVNAVCCQTECEKVGFSINPLSSQDNRVRAPSNHWSKELVDSVTLDSVIRECDAKRVFVKVDVQGYEQHVFAGFTMAHFGQLEWLCEMEFAPKWLESQGTDPVEFLREIVALNEVAEIPSRIPYFTKNVDELFVAKLGRDEVADFCTYVKRLAGDNEGWTDLLVRPSRKIQQL
jgi:FkbM family methyltransferase